MTALKLENAKLAGIGTVSTNGSVRRSAPSTEYGVSAFGVWTAVS